MPELTGDKIKEKLADGSIFAISVDTSVFDRYGCQLDSTVLKSLNQFKAGPIKILLSEIVINEIRNHIAREAEDTQRRLLKAIREQAKRWGQTVISGDLPDELALNGVPKETAASQIETYLAEIGAETISASDGANHSGELLRRYFEVEPPFEESKQKKNEFPDGFALLSLESIANQNRKFILCVSSDKGWKNFADQSDLLICTDELTLVLSYLNESGRATADRVMLLWRAGGLPDLAPEVEQAIQFQLDDTDFNPTASSGVEFDSEPLSAALSSIDVDAADNPIVIDAKEDHVTFTIRIDATVEFEADFSFHAFDSIDKDYVPLNSETAYKTENITFQVTITSPININNDHDGFEIDVKRRYIEVDFGELHPFMNEY